MIVCVENAYSSLVKGSPEEKLNWTFADLKSKRRGPMGLIGWKGAEECPHMKEQMMEKKKEKKMLELIEC